MSVPNFSHDFPDSNEEWEYGEVRSLKVNGVMQYLTIRVSAVGGGTVGKHYSECQYWHYSIHSSTNPQREGRLVMSGSDFQVSGTHALIAQYLTEWFRINLIVPA